MAAFADNEGSPKLYPNECRIKRDGLPEDVAESLRHQIGPVSIRVRETPRHYYYEWMRDDD